MKIFFAIIIIIVVSCIAFGGWQYLATALRYLVKPRTYITIVKDIYAYFKERKWEIFTDTGIIMYGGLFGTGKTLQMVHYAEQIYRNYKNVKIYSNVTLNNTPFEPFLYLDQLTDPVEEGQVAIYVCDEFGSLFNSRNYANCELNERQYLTVLNQIRKENKLLLISTQRYGMVDKLFRQVCKEWRECHHVGRFFYFTRFDPYKLEFALDPNLVPPISILPHCLFATNEVFGAYNTKERVLGFGQENIKTNWESGGEVNRDMADKYIKRKYRKKA